MATKLVQPPIPSSHLVQSIPRTRKALKPPSTTNWTNPRSKFTRFEVHPFGISRSNHLFIRGTVEQSSGLLEEDDKGTIFQTKSSINRALGGTNRGVFGVTSAKRAEIEALVKQLESLNPTPNPTFNLEKVSGCWKLIYSTITILGSKRTKLGLRDFVTLGDFLQIIDAAESKAVNVIKFSARGLNLLTGQLTIKASFSIVSASRVNIKYDNSNITPEQLMNVFRKNYDLLLSIFNPEGWLDITYVDDTMRIGRDDKGNIFILERSRDDQNEL